MIPTISSLCKWLCFGKVKSTYGCYVGFFFALPIALFFAITAGLILGGGWTESLLLNVFKLTNYKIIVPFFILGSIIGFLLVCILFLGIGANIGNFIGDIISKIFSKK